LNDLGREGGRHAHVGVSGRSLVAKGYLLLHDGGGKLLMAVMLGLVLKFVGG
jgi:hypothetical protein